mgnify:CR=1 FL=1
MSSRSILKLDLSEFRNLAEKIGHEVLVLKWLYSQYALSYAADPVTEILLNDPDPIVRKMIREKIQKLRDIELDRRLSGLDAGQLLVVVQLIASANAASKKLARGKKNAVPNDRSK